MRNKMKKLILLMALLMAMPLILGAATLNVPVTGGNYTGTISINCTTTTPTALNATIRYNATGGAAEQATTLTSILNSTVGDVDFSESTSISALADLRTYNFTCRITNATYSEFSPGILGVTVDNTAPVITVSTGLSRTTSGRTVTYSTSVTDATSTVQTSACNVQNPENTNNSLSVDVTDRSYSFDRLVDTGTWVFSCTGTDYAGNIGTTATKSVTVSSAGAVEEELPVSPIKGKTQIIVIILVIAGIWYWWNK